MSSQLRETVKKLPVIGPVLYHLYLNAFHQEGKTLTIQGGYLQGTKFRKFMHTFHEDYIAGDYESELQEILISIVKPGSVFYDVGSNIGFMALLTAKLVGPEGFVVAFEPGPKTARQLASQVAANKFRNVLVEECAVSDKVGTSRFQTNTYSVMASLADDKSGVTDSAMQVVRTTMLDHFIITHKVPQVLKIDVEGAELAVIAGAQKLLTEHRPILVVELHSEALSQGFHQMMTDLNYQVSLPTGEAAPPGDYNRFVVARPIPA